MCWAERQGVEDAGRPAEERRYRVRRERGQRNPTRHIHDEGAELTMHPLFFSSERACALESSVNGYDSVPPPADATVGLGEGRSPVIGVSKVGDTQRSRKNVFVGYVVPPTGLLFEKAFLLTRSVSCAIPGILYSRQSEKTPRMHRKELGMFYPLRSTWRHGWFLSSAACCHRAVVVVVVVVVVVGVGVGVVVVVVVAVVVVVVVVAVVVVQTLTWRSHVTYRRVQYADRCWSNATAYGRWRAYVPRFLHEGLSISLETLLYTKTFRTTVLNRSEKVASASKHCNPLTVGRV